MDTSEMESLDPELQRLDTPSEISSEQHSSTRPKRIFYTEELKLQLVRLCINNRDRFLEPGSEAKFWQFMTVLFKDVTGYHSADIRKKVISPSNSQ